MAKAVSINLLRFALALVFVFSGFVKAVDPMGTVHKIAEYAEVLGVTLHPVLLLVGAWLLIGIEYLMGVALFFGLYRRFYLWLITAFLAVMTPLTLVLALTNPISDCGCFGDFLTLTHWQTFGKNVALLLMSIIVLWGSKRVWRVIPERTQWLVFVYAAISIVLFMQYNLRHLPAWDFRPYSIGTNVAKSMTIPDEAPRDEYETIFILEKDGSERTFTLEDYPDSTWAFVRRESRLVSKGYVPPITDFCLTALDGEDVTWDVLELPGYVFFLVARDLSRTNEGLLDVINDLYDYAKVGGYPFYMLTSSNEEVIEEWTAHTGASYSYLNVDEVLLKTMIRANTGLIVLKDATIVGKWSAADLPRDEQLVQAMEYNNELMITPREMFLKRAAMLLCMFFPLLFFAVI